MKITMIFNIKKENTGEQVFNKNFFGILPDIPAYAPFLHNFTVLSLRINNN